MVFRARIWAISVAWVGWASVYFQTAIFFSVEILFFPLILSGFYLHTPRSGSVSRFRVHKLSWHLLPAGGGAT